MAPGIHRNRTLLPIGLSILATFNISTAIALDDIEGMIRGPDGGEAGVWVIAETTDLRTTFRKIVVTDDDGRFLIPDLPDASYDVWSRGYGIDDSYKESARPGDRLTINASVAETARKAAQNYPANYWYSLLDVPKTSEFPGTGDQGNGISPRVLNQAQWVDRLKDGCQLCHQMGNLATREIPEPSNFDSTRHAWDQRLQMGRGAMIGPMYQLGRKRAVDVFADWTDRIMAGEIPEPPPRPDGIQQNLVLTQWGWSNPEGFVHDNVSTDKRNPKLYPDGQVFGVAQTQGRLTITDPLKHQSRELTIPMREAGGSNTSYVGGGPSNPHNPMMDDQNRVWMTSSIRRNKNSTWCSDSEHPSVQQFPLKNSGRQLSYFDVDTEKFVLIDTCYSTHHLQFAYDDNNTLWSSGDMNVVGWLDTKMFDETQDERASQGWCPTILDTSGDGRVGEYVGPDDAVDPTKDKRVTGFAYGIIPNPADGSVWFTRPYPNMVPGQILRLDPKTCLTEQYQPPFGVDTVPASQWGHGPRGIDIDRNGIIWTALGGSGHIASFDRSKCKVLNGPKATGQHCPEGWSLHSTPGPQMKGVTSAGNADFHYYIWVDQFDTLGLGTNVPIANGTTSDSLIAWLPESSEMVTLRVPYPLGFYTRGLDGRIDDPEAGWKGRGVWASNNSVVVWHNEGGRGMTSEIVRFQIRPHPLAD
ncbi:MAG: carboxypeptidase-like regulatory domain-containing protein [Pseudomonadota bacterium]|nr:carboxypeptidase-like regulatory domain-containing protein [Pseudomonadota bacterium]|tara:strand:- start:710 stop:2800 length:2091 start_codon:yes stop_codon:yes gene_type:complete